MALSAFKRDELGDYAELRVGASLDWGNDLTNELVKDADTINSSSWAVDAGLSTSSPQVIDDVKTSVFLTCSQAGVMWVTNTIVTLGGRTYIEKFRIIGKS